MFESSDLVSEDLKILENFLNNSSENSNISLVSSVISHLIKAGGKRLRPALVFIVCKMLSCQDEEGKRIRVAAAIEFIHNATLLHDDVLDESDLRRGISTANKIWGNKTSILVGDFLLTMAFQWLIECENFDVLSILSQSSATIVSGEIKQMLICSNITMTEQDYIDVVSAKTAALFAASCEAAAALAKVSVQQREALKSFGVNFGIAFQIIDDVLDYSGEQSGKNLGNDFYNRKVTLPVIISYSLADETEKEFWQSSFSAVENCSNFQKAISYIKNHKAIELAKEKAESYIKIAKESLDIFPSSLYKTALINLLDFTLHRKL
ncbi:polyprenyl synthetase family protein [Candidatus Mesenet endosymbiont of Phosphuga atrata]|uniref:polyprenyl synthetase family protein n=1 Tax=Candidatus Mesenet endosymbiont of Phosphuga atrata TaxID=3066221 RepID=UPI0030D52DFF